ncbi:Sel1 repeat protein [Herbaspirillum sp. CF444]|uniref:tetratricopeptide repeat protein n=1 Tax=Herbaspirillum sp. CF444 TaxID=1144319 RepID=UPI00027273BA|nr:SEL1-like repeat protein [Herbaspirillum sp. CF444]EJL88570.1 Sel1 repeat protein [Herbaspirillum sp. CF444]
MASREDLAIIRAARAGQAEAQLALGRRYLFGGNGLPQSFATALHWLDRAARQGAADAWSLIGEHIPYDVVAQAPRPLDYVLWYERAFDAGLKAAGLAFARLVLAYRAQAEAQSMLGKAIKVLEAEAHAGTAEAQWLLAQQQAGGQIAGAAPAVAGESRQEATQAAAKWAQKAADAGVGPAQLSLADAAWLRHDREDFIRRALPLGRSLLAQYGADLPQLNAPSEALARYLGDGNIVLLSRLAQVLSKIENLDVDEAQQLLELGAYADDKTAQLSLGLFFARMQEDGGRAFPDFGSANYKKAIRWLTQAGERGLASAWFALSRIYLKPEFSQRNLADAQHYLERAAEMGHSLAQLECGSSAWRNRRDDPSNDVRAVYWLQKAAAQNNADARDLLDKIADRPAPADWAVEARRHMTREFLSAYPFLAARLELAILFGLTRPEALLIDLKQADCGHCLVVDIRDYYARSKRRLILIETGDERQVLNRIGRLFEDVDCSLNGPEGNYRQRMYRLKTALPQAADEREEESDLAEES